MRQNKMQRVEPIGGQVANSTRVSAKTEILKEQRIMKKKAMDEKLRNLVQNYNESRLNFGEEHYNTLMLRSFIEIVCQMKLLNEQLESTLYAFETLSASMELMDTTMETITEIMKTASQGHNMFSKWKAVRQANKFAKSIKYRFAAMTATVSSLPKIMGVISKSLNGIGCSFNKNLDKMKKGDKKKGGAPAPAGGLSPETMSVLGKMGISDIETGSSGTPAGGAGMAAGGVNAAANGGSSAPAPNTDSSDPLGGGIFD